MLPVLGLSGSSCDSFKQLKMTLFETMLRYATCRLEESFIKVTADDQNTNICCLDVNKYMQ